GITHPGSYSVINVPFRIIKWMKNKLGDWRIESVRQLRGFLVHPAVAKSTIHGVDLDPIDQILISGRHGIINAWGVAIHGGVHGFVGNAAFNSGWRDVCIGW